MRRTHRSTHHARTAYDVTPSSIDRATLALRIACSGPVSLTTLHALDALVERHPDAIDLRFARACLLEDLGRPAAAESAYAHLLERDPAHRGALINAATAAFVDGRTSLARTLYERAVAAHPDDSIAHLDLANVLADIGDMHASRAHYERALELDPACSVAEYGLAVLLAHDDPAAAQRHRARALATPIVAIVPSTAIDPLRVLVPITADGGNLVTTLFFDPAHVEAITLVAESACGDAPLPPHDLIFNAVADADRSAAALDAVDHIVRASGRPCINPPERIRPTGRVAMSERLRGLPGVVAPRTIAFRADALDGAALEAAGFRYPVIVRVPGYHAGRHAVLVHDADDLATRCADLPGDERLVITFVDTRDRDGAYRKYRMLAIDGALVPLHLARSRRWLVHYFSADNAWSEASRTREAAFLADPRGHLGERASAALENVRETLALDYGGIDFALDAEGNVVVFEANATFAIYFPDDDATGAYRTGVTEAAVAAVRAMIERWGRRDRRGAT